MTDARTGRSDIRPAVLKEAISIGATEGLERLTIGRMATLLGASKSGVFGLFGSKEQMQLAAIEEARATFVAAVIAPALQAAPGLVRLRRLCDAWLDHTSNEPQSGGCFFLSVAAEFTARPGPVRDSIVSAWDQWYEFHRQTIAEAVRLGEMNSDTDPGALTFELTALGRSATSDLALFGDAEVIVWARHAMHAALRRYATDSSRVPEPSSGR
ncbi:TetR/AcrR family transcriptional regulator [Nocardia sp. BSTN01]|uniref:TetR/AcrR family transcriptional regulator n=1 Tax=Nocardia sp. BSTN01 TaxID=2783665 RepID=UPI00189044E6|nr:TetR/AcrR family transcriptional regulator [Nocardia sp. BSTN01]MBF4999715.1 TetR/AcrR family transcriptional regulator [Nocardia sp. BSTN01]